MRTTIRIDDDLLRELKERARREDVPFSAIVNQTLRRGLLAQEAARRDVLFREKTFAMGTPAVNLDNALDIAAALEDEETVRSCGLNDA